MNKNIEVKLTPSGIEKAIRELNSLKKKVDDLPYLLTQEIANDAANFLKEQYANRPYSLVNNTYNAKAKSIDPPETPNIDIIPTQYGHQIVATGKDILYDEFGTGEVGKSTATGDFLKYRGQFNLNDYNSGKFVSKNINQYGRHYWFYNGNYTEGIPAGKQVFNTRNYILNEGIKKATKKVMGDLL